MFFFFLLFDPRCFRLNKIANKYWKIVYRDTILIMTGICIEHYLRSGITLQSNIERLHLSPTWLIFQFRVFHWSRVQFSPDTPIKKDFVRDRRNNLERFQNMFLSRFERHRFGGHWQVGLRTGESGSMLIYTATSTQDNGEFGVKIEAKRPFQTSFLRREFEVYSALNEMGTEVGFLEVYEFFTELRFYAMVMQPHGKTLATLFNDFTAFTQKNRVHACHTMP